MLRQTVTVVQVTTTEDDYGDTTEATLQQEVSRTMFEPQQPTERTDSRSPGVVTPAKFYLPVAISLNADDVIVDAEGTWWQVIGGSSVWDRQTEVAVSKVGAV